MAVPLEITDEYIHQVRLKYDALFWRQPNVWSVGEGFLSDGRGGWTEEVGIDIWVTTKVDQSTLPPEDRIPDCLEGVLVRITEKPAGIEPIPWVPEDSDEEETNGVPEDSDEEETNGVPEDSDEEETNGVPEDSDEEETNGGS